MSDYDWDDPDGWDYEPDMREIVGDVLKFFGEIAVFMLAVALIVALFAYSIWRELAIAHFLMAGGG